MKYYCIGIKGSGMSTLAQILYDLGNEVIGYDDAKEEKYTEAGLKKRNIPIYYDGSAPLEKDTIVTYSKAVPNDHKELQRVRDLGLEIQGYNDLLGHLTTLFETTSVCGTHGKTTTSLLLSHILGNSIGCNYFVGDGSGFADKKNRLFVIESCEYQKTFLAYHPTNVILTNIELEHTECYNGIEDIIATFNTFVNKAHGLVVMCGDDLNVRQIKTDLKTIYYGFNENNDYIIKNLELTSQGSQFDVYQKDTFFGHFDTSLYGRHMVLNSVAALILANYYGVSKEIIHTSLETFEGAKRRFKEEKINGEILIDDYAHHPTEIRVTLEAARQKYPNREIVAIFLPNTYSRTKELESDFVTALDKADISYVMDIDSDREKASDFVGVSSDNIIAKLKNGHKISIEEVDTLLKHKNAVFCFMSCTHIYLIEEAFKNRLQELN